MRALEPSHPEPWPEPGSVIGYCVNRATFRDAVRGGAPQPCLLSPFSSLCATPCYTELSLPSHRWVVEAQRNVNTCSCPTPPSLEWDHIVSQIHLHTEQKISSGKTSENIGVKQQAQWRPGCSCPLLLGAPQHRV